jgi:hypothetical protein
MTKTDSRPKYACTMPPKPEPTAKLTAQVALDSAFAIAVSSPAVILGIEAVRAGSNSAHITVSANSRMYKSHIWPGPCTSSIEITIAARM